MHESSIQDLPVEPVLLAGGLCLASPSGVGTPVVGAGTSVDQHVNHCRQARCQCIPYGAGQVPGVAHLDSKCAKSPSYRGVVGGEELGGDVPALGLVLPHHAQGPVVEDNTQDG